MVRWTRKSDDLHRATVEDRSPARAPESDREEPATEEEHRSSVVSETTAPVLPHGSGTDAQVDAEPRTDDQAARPEAEALEAEALASRAEDADLRTGAPAGPDAEDVGGIAEDVGGIAEEAPSPAPRPSRLGEILVEQGVITRDYLARALGIQADESPSVRRRLGEILVDDLGVERHAVYREVSRAYAIREIEPTDDDLDESRIRFVKTVLDRLPPEARREYVERRLVPWGLEGEDRDLLVVLSSDPIDPGLPELLRPLKAPRLEIAYCRFERLAEILALAAPTKQEFGRTVTSADGREIAILGHDDELSIDEEALDAEINQSHLTNLIEGLISEAVRQGASDLHIVPAGSHSTRFMYRLDGRLEHWFTQEETRPEAVLAVVKDRCKNVDRFERDAAQDGFFQREIDGHLIRFRVSVLPIVGSAYERKLESIVIRVLDDRKVITDLDKLGLKGVARQEFEKAIDKPQGLVILTGPTGCGKSTTLIAALNHVMDPSKNVLTVEDPVEYLVRGARQIKINQRLDFEDAIRSILRHDPDIVMVGEMRDKETAEIAIKLANTGHLTFSTLHTNDAPSAVSRLFKMGIEPFLIAYAINLIVAQRLVRRLCEHCKEPAKDLDPEVLRQMGFSDHEISTHTIYRAVGCRKCLNGYSGRVAIHEVLPFTHEIRQIVVQAGEDVDEDRIRAVASEHGMNSLRASGLARVLEGITTLEEIMSATIED